jgi:hypothetical protein
VTVAGWIGAEERRGGTPAGVLTPAGVIDVDECLAATDAAMAAPSSVSSVGRRLSPSVRQIGRVIENGRSGLLYEPDGADGLAAGLLRLAEDGDLRARIGDAGRERVLESWTWDEITKRCLEHLP